MSQLKAKILQSLKPAYEDLEEKNVEPKETELSVVQQDNWDAHRVDAKHAYFDPHRNLALVCEDSPYLLPDVFHEFLGHGSHFEHTRQGARLKHSKSQQAIRSAEISAAGIEYQYAQQTGVDDVYSSKKNALEEERRHIQEATETKIDERGFKPFLWDQGYPKHYSSDNLYDTITPFLKDDLSLALHYGSGKPRSDVDLFLIGQTQYYERDWLDIYQVPERKVTDLIDNLDISVLDPLFTGTLIHGDKRELERLKKRAKNKSIQPAAVHHNERRAHQQSTYDHPDAESYVNTYAQHAAHLRRGKKHLSKTSLTDGAS